MDLAKSSLETKRKIIEQNTQMGLYHTADFILKQFMNASISIG
jgi:hypothetical protein